MRERTERSGSLRSNGLTSRPWKGGSDGTRTHFLKSRPWSWTAPSSVRPGVGRRVYRHGVLLPPGGDVPRRFRSVPCRRGGTDHDTRRGEPARVDTAPDLHRRLGGHRKKIYEPSVHPDRNTHLRGFYHLNYIPGKGGETASHRVSPRGRRDREGVSPSRQRGFGTTSMSGHPYRSMRPPLPGCSYWA